jgi:hypothetical protein
MKDNDMANGADSGVSNGTVPPHPMDNEENKKAQTLNRAELEKKTGKELAQIVHANGYSKKKLITLEKMAKADLITIIFQKSDTPSEESGPKARAPRKQSEVESTIEMALGFLNHIKMQREQEPINAYAMEQVKTGAVAYLDNAMANNEVSSKSIGTIGVVAVALFVIVDGLVGIKNIPTLFQTVKQKLLARKHGTK